MTGVLIRRFRQRHMERTLCADGGEAIYLQTTEKRIAGDHQKLGKGKKRFIL